MIDFYFRACVYPQLGTSPADLFTPDLSRIAGWRAGLAHWKGAAPGANRIYRPTQKSIPPVPGYRSCAVAPGYLI